MGASGREGRAPEAVYSVTRDVDPLRLRLSAVRCRSTGLHTMGSHAAPLESGRLGICRRQWARGGCVGTRGSPHLSLQIGRRLWGSRLLWRLE